MKSETRNPKSEIEMEGDPLAAPEPAFRPSPFALIRGLHRLKDFCDYLGGSRELPPEGFPGLSPLWRGLWWGLLAGAILLFCGQTSKFIYIDF